MGQKILYYLILSPISKLPFFILYRISDVMFLFFYYLLRYRKKVIVDNIYSSFPLKTDQEKKAIVKKFYKHFCDLIIESVKNFSISKKQAAKRYSFHNTQLLKKYKEEGKSVITMIGHYGSWEILFLALGNIKEQEQYVIYKPLSSDIFENKMKKSRERNGVKMIPMQETKEFFRQEHKHPVSILFGSDQWPSNPKNAFWTEFMGKETPFLYGAEKYAKEFNWPVVYCDIKRIKRGYYSVTYQDITDNPNDLKYGEIIGKYVGRLEKTIFTDPAYWLWSHKRWKKSKEEIFNS